MILFLQSAAMIKACIPLSYHRWIPDDKRYFPSGRENEGGKTPTVARTVNMPTILTPVNWRRETLSSLDIPDPAAH